MPLGLLTSSTALVQSHSRNPGTRDSAACAPFSIDEIIPSIERSSSCSLRLRYRTRFKKKSDNPRFTNFEGSFASARARLRGRRHSIATVLSEFKRAIEARAVDAFWHSRKKHLMRSRPEKIAQALLAVFAKGVVGKNGVVLREIASGIGFVDVGVSFGGTLHLV